MRIRTLELPSRVEGDIVHYPFVVVVDRVTHAVADVLPVEEMRADVGAAAVWVFAADLGDVELGESE